MKKTQLIAIGAILLATLFWGMTFAFIKTAVSSLSVYSFLFWRFGIAAILLFPFSFKTLQKEGKKSLKAGTLLSLFLLGTVLFQTMGLKTTLASTASFITGISVILVPLFTCCIEKCSPKIKILLASVIALLGIGSISLQTNLSISSGDLWVLLCAVCFALYILFAGKYAKGHSPLALSTLQCIVIFVVAALLGIMTNSLTWPDEIKIWGAILFCSLFASIFAFLLQLHFQKYISATTTAIIFSCEPIFATLTAVLLLDEQLSLRFYMGAALIFLAIIVSELNLKKKTMPQE
jgi:drug/metabolite transporter (DMT)-like permease